MSQGTQLWIAGGPGGFFNALPGTRCELSFAKDNEQCTIIHTADMTAVALRLASRSKPIEQGALEQKWETSIVENSKAGPHQPIPLTHVFDHVWNSVVFPAPFFLKTVESRFVNRCISRTALKTVYFQRNSFSLENNGFQKPCLKTRRFSKRFQRFPNSVCGNTTVYKGRVWQYAGFQGGALRFTKPFGEAPRFLWGPHTPTQARTHPPTHLPTRPPTHAP